MHKTLLVFLWLLNGCAATPVHYRVAPDAILDTGSERTSITWNPGGEPVGYVRVTSVDGVSNRPLYPIPLDYAGCKVTLVASVRKHQPPLSRVLLGRDFIRACALTVTAH